ncbi:peroxiredoxin [Pukyongia salina]|uniref:Peroxiredoxin n=1 Tax=Pukyongia salina TaxID=2094025 RepID=A0A2S0HYP3_9FLAO|nr:TlpA disulfide reductase family protein [Pukyongia salina]AVI51789.1 peroxiredoxin [Pukyongia salina]
MRRYLALFITVLLFSCSEDSENYTLDGTAQGFADGTLLVVYFIEDNNQPVPADTLTVENEKFNAIFPKSDKLQLGYLASEDPRGTVIFFPENENLKATLYKDSMIASNVTGSRQNEMYTQFVKQMKEFNKRKQANSQRFQEARRQQDNILIAEIQRENVDLVNEETAYKVNFIKENGNSIFSLMLTSELLQRKEISVDVADEIVKNLPPKTASSLLAGDIMREVEKMKRADIGGVAPDFAAPTPTGEMLSLKETLGKYTIIDFWASWCKPCRRENPNVVRVYEKYHDKGLNIISVSLDREGQKERWLQAIKDDKMDWYHVSNLKFWQDPIARLYNVRSIPATFLLDENGKIIAKNLRGQALEAKISSLLGP